MKILVLTPFFPENSKDHVGEFVLDSILSLKKENQEIIVIVTRPWIPAILEKLRLRSKKQADTSRLPTDIKVHVFYCFSIPRYYLAWVSNKIYTKYISVKIIKLARLNQFDLIHAHSEISALPAVVVGKKLSIPVVATIHGVEAGSKAAKRYWRFSHEIISNMIPRLDRLILVGFPLIPFFKKISEKSDHFRIVSNGLKFFPEILSVKNEDWPDILRIISVSNLNDEGKCIDITLLSLAKLLKRGKSNWIYTIVGDGVHRKQYESLAISLGLEEKVFFIGSCSHQDVYKHLLQGDIFCLPSCREAFGIAHLEAVALGLLAIGVKGQGPQTFIEHGVTGLLVEPQDVDDLVTSLEFVIDCPETANAMARQGQQHVLKNFTWENHAKKLISVYKEACS